MSDQETEWWEDLRIDPLPHVHSVKGFSLHGITTFCPYCDREADRVVARHITEHPQCIECAVHSVCEPCAVRFNTRARFYGDRFIMLTDQGWKTFLCGSPWKTKLRKAWRWVLRNLNLTKQ